ncbi:RNA polymerase-associated protein RapA [uncultured Thiohalocapsa sp.]|uniref:RNA polymerase-associated protein RapA n=1 Tax=uncultured Thiohalocapsa sp. TaxID=768990 RepID=UPI0025E9D7E6|nr:RNA polymerase-associated protein RapA [uncultured Thiohalocapsa sp.]
MPEAPPEFRPGQRWLSETQAELGLGIVEASDERTVTMRFPATGEQRIYARRTAPLWRAVFGVGDLIRDIDGLEVTIVAVDEQSNLLVYSGEDVDGTVHKVPEQLLAADLHLNRPQQKLLAGRLDRDTWFRLRQRTWRHRGGWPAEPVRGLVGARIAPIPHQLYIAAEVAERFAPRVLLADEVGLGKTIEAGLVLHRMLLDGRARRVLVLVPEPLLHQWLVELLRRFNLHFALFDRERLEARGDANAFESEQRVLCSLDLLTATPAHAAAVLGADWDLLIVDEAHHLAWTPEDSGLDYDIVEALADQTPAVLLLTATPEQLGRMGHFGRLRLLDPERFSDYQAFLAEEDDYAAIAAIAARLLAGAALDVEQQARLTALLGDTNELETETVVERLLDRHGTSRLLFRNTRAAVPGFPGRRPHASPLTPAVGDGGPRGEHDQAEPIHPEVGAGPAWPAQDPRVPWLLDLLQGVHPAKVLLIAARAQTVLALRAHLHERHGVHAAVFHEGMEIVERDRAAAYFADPEEGTRLLLCSEIGSEGRNFQFAHHLVLFDLPLDPELLEQRIGRLDRIGQSSAVEIHVPYLAGTGMETLYRWYAEGLDAFAQHCPAASAVYERLGGRLREALAANKDPAGADVNALVQEAASLREALNASLAAGRDRLLELGSHRPEVSAELVQRLEDVDRDPALFEYLNAFWDAFGVDQEPGAGGALVLHPGRHMLQEHFPGLPEDGLTVTFDRNHALAHEDRAFMTWEHPLTLAAMDQLTGSDLGSAAVILTRTPGFSAGTLLLEMLYVAECPAPPTLQVQRFLPRLGLRLLLDERGRDHAAAIATETLSGKCLTGNRKLASALLAAKTQSLERMLAAGEARAETAVDAMRQAAVARMQRLLDAEIERLTALAKVNASIRDEEIGQLQLRRERLAQVLSRAHLRLDALRLVAHG